MDFELLIVFLDVLQETRKIMRPKEVVHSRNPDIFTRQVVIVH